MRLAAFAALVTVASPSIQTPLPLDPLLFVFVFGFVFNLILKIRYKVPCPTA